MKTGANQETDLAFAAEENTKPGKAQSSLTGKRQEGKHEATAKDSANKFSGM